MERCTLELLHGIGFSDPPRKVWPLRGETCCSSRSPVTHPMHFGGLRGLPGLGCRGWDAVPVRQTTSEGCHAHNGVLALATVQFMKTL